MPPVSLAYSSSDEQAAQLVQLQSQCALRVADTAEEARSVRAVCRRRGSQPESVAEPNPFRWCKNVAPQNCFISTNLSPSAAR